MYFTRNVTVHPCHPSYSYFEHISRCSNNLHNAALFRMRQLMSSATKSEKDFTANEKAVHDEFSHALPLMKRRRTIPASGCISYAFLEEEMRITANPDYYAHGLPVQTAQHVIRHVCRDMASFFQAVKAYNANPSRFSGRPQLPKYKHKKGLGSFDITNQDCIIRVNKKGNYTAKLPLTKERISLGKGIQGRLKEVHVTPVNGTFQVSFVFDDLREPPELNQTPERIVGIDFGVNNLMAITNNCHLECLLYRGGVIKSINHIYNKKIAKLVSMQTRGTNEKYVPDESYYRITNRRNNQIKDQMLKIGKHFITWCVEQRIDTIVMGSTPFWKFQSRIGKKNNQQFVQIPFDYLKRIIKWQSERNGIRIINQEESYTSRASFSDMDDIPVYGDEPNKYRFSGKRVHRGLYETKSNGLINADLNASANILRKALPNAISSGSDIGFGRIQTIIHPEYETRTANCKQQKTHKQSRSNGIWETWIPMSTLTMSKEKKPRTDSLNQSG